MVAAAGIKWFSSAIAIIIFALIAMVLKVPELDLLTNRIRQKLRR